MSGLRAPAEYRQLYAEILQCLASEGTVDARVVQKRLMDSGWRREDVSLMYCKGLKDNAFDLTGKLMLVPCEDIVFLALKVSVEAADMLEGTPC